MEKPSGIGYNYGTIIADDAWVLSDLLDDQGYDYPQAYVEAFAISVNSPVAELPATLLDLHVSSMSEMPFDPLCWDFEGNWVGPR